MKHKFKSLFLASQLTMTATACGPKGGGSGDQQPKTPAPQPIGPDASIHADASHPAPEQGFYFQDLLKSYCSMTFSAPVGPSGHQAPAGTSVLFAGFVTDGVVTVLLPDPESRDVAATSSQAVTSVKTTSCNLDAASHEDLVSVLVASVPLYSTDERSGDPMCVLKPGPLAGGELHVTSYTGKHSWQVDIPDNFKQACGGAGQGYAAQSPNYELLLKQTP